MCVRASVCLCVSLSVCVCVRMSVPVPVPVPVCLCLRVCQCVSVSGPASGCVLHPGEGNSLVCAGLSSRCCCLRHITDSGYSRASVA